MEPVVYSVLFADKIITENNGKKCLIGVFGAFNLPTFPMAVSPWFIYIGMTNLLGHYNFSISLSNDNTDSPLFQAKGEIDSEDPKRDVEIIIPLEKLTFLNSGNHTLALLIDGTLVATRILRVNQSENKPQP
jgi:hypothetical protein